MSQPVTVNLDNEQVEYLSNLVERGHCDSVSEAARKEINARHVPWQTPLRKWTRIVANVFGFASVIWLGLTFLAPVGYRVVAIPLLSVAFGMYVLDRVLAYVEPGVSHRLFGWYGGDAA